MRGIIFKAMSGFYYVESGEGTAECRARGRFRLDKTTPLVGDHVIFTMLEPGKGVLTEVLPRKNVFVRPPVANIDVMVIIASAAVPVTDPYLIDRMTAVSSKNNCEALVCINKCDLDTADTLFNTYTHAGYKTIRTSAETGEGAGELLEAICGKVCAFTGNSGVGKSSILNALDPEFGINVGAVSDKLGRGRHTTRHVELYKLRGGAIAADTPGFSSFDTELMELMSKDGLQFLFREFEPYIGGCRFQDCAHIAEPGCAVLAAVDAGEIGRSRHGSYARMYRQAAAHKQWERKQGENSGK